MDEVLLTKIHDCPTSAYLSQLSYLSKMQTYIVSGKFISRIQEYIQQREVTLPCLISMKQ